MTNSMPTFAVFHHRTFLGYVSAVSVKQAKARAKALHNVRCEVELCLNVKPTAKDRLSANQTFNAKRAAPYATPGFEARRAALIAEFKAGA